MTLREFLANWPNSIQDILSWFDDGLKKLVGGQFLDLTLGQVIFGIAVVVIILHLLFSEKA
jgi:hypothetical protein